MVNYLGVNSVRELVRQVGFPRFLQQLVDAMDSDYRRWEQFDKSARHAIHSPVGVIELMPPATGSCTASSTSTATPRTPPRGCSPSPPSACWPMWTRATRCWCPS